MTAIDDVFALTDLAFVIGVVGVVVGGGGGFVATAGVGVGVGVGVVGVVPQDDRDSAKNSVTDSFLI